CFFFQAEDGIRAFHVTGVQTCALPILRAEDAAFARAVGVRPVINSLRQARVWIDAGGGPCDLMVDTGINRLGLPPGEIGDPLIRSEERRVGKECRYSMWM